jgi:hypothetical protein
MPERLLTETDIRAIRTAKQARGTRVTIEAHGRIHIELNEAPLARDQGEIDAPGRRE